MPSPSPSPGPGSGVEACARCGHALGVGRFCVNCGHRVGAEVPAGAPAPAVATTESADWRTDTAERPRVSVPPPVVGLPEPARYPLYADEPVDRPEPAPERPTTPSAAVRADDSAPRHLDESRRSGAAAAWVPWVAALVVLLLVASLGLWLLLGGDDDTDRAAEPRQPARSEQPGRDSRTPEGRATVVPAPEPPPADPEELAGSTAVQAPAPSPATTDVSGSPVSFGAAQMVDGDPGTCWRMPGDGTGSTITFTFDEPVEMSRVGLVNGYAKTGSDGSTTFDWYAGNRRTLQVEWGFDDGTTVTQDLAETRDLQTLDLKDGVVTEQVTLRLLDVTAPGSGPASRDHTAVSEVSLTGVPAG